MTIHPIARNPLQEGVVYPVPQIPGEAVVPAQRNAPPDQAAQRVARNIGHRPAGSYYDQELQTEFYLLYEGQLGVGWRFKGREYQSTNQISRQTLRPIAYSAIVLEKFTDQAGKIYRRLLRKHPEIPNKPFDGRHKPLYTRFQNAFRSPEEIRNELKQREDRQKITIQKVIAHLHEGNDPGIEEILHPTPDELLEKYRWDIRDAALSDAVIIVHKKVPPQEQLGPEAHARFEAAERAAEKRKSDMIDEIVREAEREEQERSLTRKVGVLIEKFVSKIGSLFRCLFCRR